MIDPSKRKKRKVKVNVLDKLVLQENSSVTRGMNPEAHMVLFKSADTPSETEEGLMAQTELRRPSPTLQHRRHLSPRFRPTR